MTVFRRLAFGLILSLFAVGCAHDHFACHGKCACESSSRCECCRSGGCSCQMAQPGNYQPQASPEAEGPPPAVPPSDAASVPRRLDAKLVSQPADKSPNAPKQDDPNDASLDGTANLAGDRANVDNLPSPTEGRPALQGDSSVKIEAIGSQQTEARRRLELLIARESATLTAPEELEESATSEAMRSLPVSEPRTLPESAAGNGASSEYPPAPPLPLTLEELESADQKSGKTKENSAETTSEAEGRSKEVAGETQKSTTVDHRGSSYTLQPQPFFPEAGAPIASQPASNPPTATPLLLKGSPAESLANSAEAALQPVGTGTGTAPAQPAPALLEPAQLQPPTIQAQPNNAKPGRVRIRRSSPAAVDRMFYGW